MNKQIVINILKNNQQISASQKYIALQQQQQQYFLFINLNN